MFLTFASMKHYKPIITITLIITAFITLSGCKKPKEGTYQAVFTNSNGKTTEFYCYLHRYHDKITIDQKSGDSFTTSGVDGSLTYNKGRVNGTLITKSGGLGSSVTHSYQLTGTSKRKVIKGSYTCDTDLSSATYGTFEITEISKN